MLKRLLHLLTDSLAYGISGLLGQLIGFLLLPLYTRHLDPSDYGVMAMLAFLPQVFAILAAAGVKSAIFQQFYRADSDDRRRVVLSTAAVSVFFSIVFILTLSIALSNWIALWLIGEKGAVNVVRLSLLAAAFATFTDVPLIGLQAVRRARTVGLLNIVQLVVVVSITIYLVAWREWGLVGVVVGGLIGSFLSMVICFAMAARLFAIGFDTQIWRAMSAYSLPFLPHRIQGAIMVFWGDYMVRTHLGLSEVGLYNVATRFAIPIGFLSAAIQQAWTPYKFKVFAEEPNSAAFFRSTLTYHVCIFAYLWMGVSIWGPEAIRAMTNSSFHDAASLVWAVALIRAVQAFYPMLGTGLELGNDTRALPLVSFASLLTTIAASFCLMPLFGVYGAAFATTSAWLVIAAGYYILAQRQVPVSYDWKTITAVCLAAIVGVAAGQSVQQFPLWIRVAVITVLSIGFPIVVLLILWRSSTERQRVEVLLARVSRITSRQSRAVEKPRAERIV